MASTPDPKSAGSENGSGSGRMVIREEVYDHRPCIFKYITAITRTWGLLTLFGLWYCTVELIKEKDKYQYVHWYSLGVSITLTFFELAWLVNKTLCCARCKDDGGCCCTAWRVVLWIDDWRKTILYIALAIAEFLEFAVLAVICGVLLLVLAAFYFLKSFKYSKCVEQKRVKTTTSFQEDPKASLVNNEGPPKASDTYHTVRDESEPRVNSRGSARKPAPVHEEKAKDKVGPNPFDEDSFDQDPDAPVGTNPFGDE